jgi:hypothetical protein
MVATVSPPVDVVNDKNGWSAGGNRCGYWAICGLNGQSNTVLLSLQATPLSQFPNLAV